MITRLKSNIVFTSHAAVGGYEERRGPLGESFDFCDTSDRFGQKTWEMAEGEMGRIALNIALSKAHLSHGEIDLLVAGDLQNQCVASSVGLHSFGTPFIGVYGACSTCTESLAILSAFMEAAENIKLGAIVTTSHNSAAERQFRTPIEYGAQRSKTAQWTSTAGGAFILGKEGDGPKITSIMVGKIIDGSIKDGANMGGAMAFSAADTILDYFEQSGESPSEFDYIVTGDLGKVGSDILREILAKKIPGSEKFHTDCGLILYDRERMDAHSGASGCGTSASVLAAHFIPLLREKKIKKILFLSTGALMSPTSILQGENIFGIAPLIKIEADTEV